MANTRTATAEQTTVAVSCFMNAALSQRGSLLQLKLFLSRSANRANAGARAAAQALIGIDLVLAIALMDRFDGALGRARAAGNAIVRNLICHVDYLLYMLWLDYITKRTQMQQQFCFCPLTGLQTARSSPPLRRA